MRQQTILVVEDDAAIREVVHKYLERAGFAVLEAETGLEAVATLGESPIDLAIVDIMLPGLDGLSLTRALREATEYTPLARNRDVPIIVLTSRGAENDRLAGFDLGVDDYVVKPFSPRELVARVRAVLRRGQAGSPENSKEKPLDFEGLHIDPLRRAVIRDGEPVTLTAREFDLLWLLAGHPQRVFTREQLLDLVWGYEFFGDVSTVTVHIRRLREKIERNPANPVFIHTVWGVGYKFELS